jgi:hypothetical protein
MALPMALSSGQKPLGSPIRVLQNNRGVRNTKTDPRGLRALPCLGNMGYGLRSGKE